MRSFLLLVALTSSLPAQETIRLPLGGGLEMELVQIAPGKFIQGAPPDARREVTISKQFSIGKYPVTRGQFAHFVAATNYRTESEKGPSGGFGWEGGKLVQKKQFTWRTPGFSQTDEHPVVMVDFADAKAFCAWLSRETGKTIALPTEAQWEYAALGGGNSGEAWTAVNSAGGTKPVGGRAANGFGIHDMLGNAWEWCEDWFAPYQPNAASDPVETNPNLSDKPRRVLRGGAFSRPAGDASPTRRYRNDPGSRNADNGFRVVAFDGPAPRPAVPAPPVRLERPAPAVPASSDASEEFIHHEESAPPPSSKGSFVLILGVLGAGALLVWKFFKSLGGGLRANPVRAAAQSGRPMPESAGPGGVFSIRIVQDGFWLLGKVREGTSLNARWMGAAGTHTRTFDYHPGTEGQFVFTGDKPSGVTVSTCENDGGFDGGDGSLSAGSTGRIIGSINSMQNRDPVPPADSPTNSGRRSFSGFPSAY